MKAIIYYMPLFFILLTACKTDKKTKLSTNKKEQTIPEKIAHAHGFKNWKKVKEIQFSFNVDRDTSHFERKWIWNTQKSQITRILKKDTITYNRNTLDSITTKINGGFINDKFWLLAPYNLIWDSKNYTFNHAVNIEAPISKKACQKLTIIYGNKGGYTPGDAYDFYFGEDYIITEWVFRKGNQEDASMVTTWEDYSKESGLQISKMHKKVDSDFKLYFTNLEVYTY
ncbi:hypothetical protein [uncultured Maribacter sp.]|uniref:hypothetical protein n=1 Tax=uncultured Maribacter sp. TaxID=431308 RepID=UPI0026028A65|nr:hypothetical protein [uncultured Maribacter sp.]